MITVVSTAYDPPIGAKSRCFATVAAQIPCRHVYIDAARQDPPRSHFENLIAATRDLPDDAIVVSLDGDDWLLPGALERVQREHDAGALVTWGSFQFADGRPGFARDLREAEQARIREVPWVTTHLKTFRAGLFRRIKHEHLQDANGKWLEHARDLALMFPLIEMAGRERARYIPQVLCVYNFVNSTEFTGGTAALAAEREAVRYVRSLPRYEPCST